VALKRVSPLETAEVVSDVAVIYGTPAQISAIAGALIWHGIFPEISSNWFFTCSAAVGAHRSKQPHVSIPSSGEVVWGWSEEDEASVSLPVEHLEKISTGLENIKWMYSAGAPHALRASSSARLPHNLQRL
jgi:uncharacterized protein (DUF169 family)